MTFNISKNNVYTFKLATGEEFIAKVREDNGDHLIVDQPIQTVVAPEGLQLVPSLFSADQDAPVALNTSTIAMVADARKDVEQSYIQATSGIATADASQILHG